MNRELPNPIYILAIESSCDDTSAAVLRNDAVLSNIVAGQKIHENYGGVVPELASRAHQSNIVPVVHEALAQSGISKEQLSAIVFTQGPGLMGSLHVGVAFAKSLALALNIPLVAVHHMQAHVLAHFIRKNDFQRVPEFPFLCLTVSGGHTQLVKVNGPLQMEIVGQTIDDAAGEAFDKAAKVMGLPYPGGPIIDKLAMSGNSLKYTFPHPKVPAFDFSFSGLKTSLLYFLKENEATQPGFIEKNKADISASYQRVIVEYLLEKMQRAAQHIGTTNLALAGGVSANSFLRKSFLSMCDKNKWIGFIPPFEYCTDNAAMIGIAGYYKLLAGHTEELSVTPLAKMEWLRQ